MQIPPLFTRRKYIVNLLVIHFNVGIDVAVSVNVVITKNPEILESYYVKRALEYGYHYLRYGSHRFYREASEREEETNFFRYGKRTSSRKHVLLIDRNTPNDNRLFEIAYFYIWKDLQFYIDEKGAFRVYGMGNDALLSEKKFHICVERMISNFKFY